MKKAILFLITLFAAVLASAQTVEGSWTGKLNVMGTQLNLVFNITKTDGGTLACTLDSPDQGAKGIPAEISVSDGVKVKINVPAIMASYEGELADGQLKGTFSQGGMPFPLDLKPGKVERNRPQTPKAPYPYTTEEVTFTNTADKATLSGTLTYPAGYEKMKKNFSQCVFGFSRWAEKKSEKEKWDICSDKSMIADSGIFL